MIDNQLVSRLNANKGRQEQGFDIIDIGRTENISNIGGTPPSHAEKWCQMLCAMAQGIGTIFDNVLVVLTLLTILAWSN